MPPIDKRAALANHPLFGHLAVAELEQLLALGAERRFHDGQMIFQRGEAGASMMLVLRGQVKISIVSSEGKELIFSIIPPGECFGEIALLDGQARTADAIFDCDQPRERQQATANLASGRLVDDRAWRHHPPATRRVEPAGSLVLSRICRGRCLHCAFFRSQIPRDCSLL
jgi:hypothetical protein